jgi:PAS domain S-box-containing protein
MDQLNIPVQPIWGMCPCAIAVMDFAREPQHRKFVYVNPAFTELTGYSSDEAVGHSSALLDGPKTDQAALEACEANLSEGKPCKTALIRYRKDGSEYAAQTTLAPLLKPDGSAEFLILQESMIALRNPAAAHGSAGSLSHRAPLKEFPAGELPQHLASHPELEALQALWTNLRGNRRLPRRSDFDLETVCRWAPHLSVATVSPAGRFRFRLFGTELATLYGEDLTGRFLDEMAPRDLWSVIILHYQNVVRTARPLFAPISISNGRWYSEVSRLLLPLASEDESGAVALIMGADYTRLLA